MKVAKYNGAKIDKPGCYAGVGMDAYHGDLCAGPSISSSGLRTIEAKTPLHYWAGSYLNPDRAPQAEKDHFSFGRAAHTLLLGESGFREQFAVRPDQWADWRTKDAQNWRREQIAAGRSILTPNDLGAIRGIAASLSSHPLIRQGLLHGLIEHTIVAKDASTGVWLKSRPDVLPQADGVLCDLKTTTDASPDAVRRTVTEYGYGMQGALAAMVMESAAGIRVTDFVLVFVEKTAPHAVTVAPLGDEWLHWGRRQVRRAINKFAHCVETGEWPGYEGETTIHMPEWLKQRLDAQGQAGELPEEKAA